MVSSMHSPVARNSDCPPQKSVRDEFAGEDLRETLG
jgi:hypothetical protein